MPQQSGAYLKDYEPCISTNNTKYRETREPHKAPYDFCVVVLDEKVQHKCERANKQYEDEGVDDAPYKLVVNGVGFLSQAQSQHPYGRSGSENVSLHLRLN